MNNNNKPPPPFTLRNSNKSISSLLFVSLLIVFGMLNDSRLNILQWNCRSLNSNLDQFSQFLSDCATNYDILALQSIGTTSFVMPQFDGFHYPPYLSITESRIRTATYVKKGIHSARTNLAQLQHGHAITIEVQNEEPITLVNVYFPESVSNDNDLNWLTNIDKGRYFICGDFNCHSPLWNSSCVNSDRGGRIIEELLDNIDFCLLNDGTITRIPDVRTQNASAIDLSFCTANLFLKTYWEVLDDNLGSDHIPIHMVYQSSPSLSHQQRKNNYIYDKANWPHFQKLLEKVDYTNNFVNVEEWYSHFQTAVVSAANRSIPKTTGKTSKGRNKVNEWWNEECRVERAVYRKLVKKYKSNRSTLNFESMKSQKIKYNKTLAKAKLSYWSTFIDNNIHTYRDSSILYKKLKVVKRRTDPPQQPLVVNGIKTINPKEKADIFAETFASVSQNSSLSPNQRNFRNTQEANFDQPIFKKSPSDCQFTMLELNRAIISIKKIKKATGNDPISYAMIKKFPLKTKTALLGYFNHLWSSGSFPTAWKTAEISAIPKPGKPKKDPKSYRPIALTPHVSKLYERIVKNRLEYFLEKNNLLPKCQSGFRRGRNCIENLVKLSSHVKRAMMRRRPVLSTFYDIKRAYDTVWHAKLLDKLHKIGVSKNMYRFFQSFLRQRIIRVMVGSELSKAHILDMGIPQGSIAAPIAFSIMLSDINKLKLDRATISLYADDLAMWSTARYRRTTTNYFYRNELEAFQHNVNVIITYMEDNGFSLAADKTVFMIFTSANLDNSISIKINGTPIHLSKQVKYLGVVLDQKLSFESHINHLIEKTRKNLTLIKIMKKENGLNNVKIIRNLINSLIRSRLTYGQEIFHSAPVTYLSKLQRTETSIIKTLLNIPKTANPLLVYREIGIKPLNFSRKFHTTKSVIRLGCTENDIETELDYDFNDCNSGIARASATQRPCIFKRSISITSYAESLISEAEVGGYNVVSIPQCRFPCSPWEEQELSITTSLGDLNKSDHINLLTVLANEKIEDMNDYTLIYTDGSINDKGQTGCAFVVPELNVSKQFRLNSGISIYSAELYALENALLYALDNIPKSRICVLTDSKSALQAISGVSNNRIEAISNIINLIYDIKKSGREIKLQWIPSHIGLKGNDLADSAAKKAASNESIPITDISFTLSEITAKLRKANDRLWKNEFKKYATDLNWCDPDSILIPEYNAPPKYLYVFLRLRCKSTRFDVYQIDCCCSKASFSIEHIFHCDILFNQLLLTRTFCSREQVPFTYLGLLGYHSRLGWAPANTFIHELMESDVGHLV